MRGFRAPGAFSAAVIAAAAALAACSTSPRQPVTRGDAGADAGDAGGGPRPGGGHLLRFAELAIDGEVKALTDFAFLPGRPDELLLLEQHGRVSHHRLAGATTRRLGDFMLDGLETSTDCGLLGLAFDPDFARSGYLYLSFCTSIQSSGIYRFRLDTDDLAATAATRTEVIVVREPRAQRGWHNIGSFGFEPDGTMWLLAGEKTLRDNAQERDNNLGKLLRIVPEREPGGSGYAPAAGNAFDPADGSPDIYSYGLRSPWRGVRDSRGRFFIGDVGEDTFEEVSLVRRAGQNLGWSRAEGPCEEDCDGLTDPLVHWGHFDDVPYNADDPETIATTGRVAFAGAFYEVAGGGGDGQTGPDRYDGLLTNRLLFSDICLGWVRALEVDDQGEVVMNQHLGHRPYLTSMRQAGDGYLYATTYGGCEHDKVREEARLFRVELAP